MPLRLAGVSVFADITQIVVYGKQTMILIRQSARAPRVHASVGFFVLVLVFLGCHVRHSEAEITLSTDFESASLDLDASLVDGNTVTLVGESTWSRLPNHYQWVYFRASGVDGLRPRFILDGNLGPDGGYLGVSDSTSFFYSYDQERWWAFENGRLRTSQPFVEDAVYIAHSIPYPYTRTESKMQEWAQSEFVARTRSADNRYSVGTIANSTQLGPASLDLFGFRIADDSAIRPKTKVMLVGGNHSGEVAANWALEGAVEFILGDDPRAVALREHAEIFVYPQADPLGRVEGYYRGNSQNPAGDHNGFWSAPVTKDDGGFREVSILNDAWKWDTEGAVDITIDFHGKFDAQPNFVLTDQVGAETQFIESLGTLEPNPTYKLATDRSPFGISGIGSFGVGRARTTEAVNSRLLFAPEIRPGDSVETYWRYGQSLAISLLDQVRLSVCDLNHDQQCNLSDLDHNDGLYSVRLDVGSDLLVDTRRFDLNGDQFVDSVDLVFWLSEAAKANGLNTPYLAGDSNLDGVVDSIDLQLFANGFRVGRDWGTGDFDGNARVEFRDFLELAHNFGNSSASSISVPEPKASTMLIAVCLFAHWFRMSRNAR